MPTKIDLLGRVFSRWTVIAEDRSSGTLRWLCRCVCGTERPVWGPGLTRGESRSCGCLKIEETVERTTTHGMAGTPIHITWKHMKGRCGNPNDSHYKDYGGRGIKVCAKWTTFEGFLEDMGSSYRPGLTIERNDVHGNYEASNCRWIPRAEQAQNKQNSVFVEAPQGRLTITAAARTFGLSVSALKRRIEQGWPPERLFSPPRPYGGRKPKCPASPSSVGST